jgi:hypothetical protein
MGTLIYSYWDENGKKRAVKNMFPAESTITAPTWHKPNVSQLVPGEAKT